MLSKYLSFPYLTKKILFFVSYQLSRHQCFNSLITGDETLPFLTSLPFKPAGGPDKLGTVMPVSGTC